MYLSFRTKLVLAMMTVVIGVAGSILFLMEHKAREATTRQVQDRADEQIQYFFALQESRLGAVKEQCIKFVKSVRLLARISESEVDADDLYFVVDPEFLPDSEQGARRNLPTLLRIIDRDGKPFQAAHSKLELYRGRKRLEEKLSWVSKSLPKGTNQQVGYLISEGTNTPSRPAPKLLPSRSNFRPGRQAGTGVEEFVITKIFDPVTKDFFGSLVVGFEMKEFGHLGSQTGNNANRWGMLIDDQLVMDEKSLALDLQSELNKKLLENLKTDAPNSGSVELSLGGEEYRVLFNFLNPNSGFPKSYQVCLYSRADELQAQKELRMITLVFAGIGCIGALVFSFVLSHGLSVPIHELVKGTREIAAGNYKTKVPVRSRDDIGQLTASFNEMAVGLEQRETFRNFLNMVTDPKVAQEMIDGKIQLGGEVREVSVLFCDIRGFTALTENMPPSEVIEMLNEHMTLLTNIVRDHNGVVDKFVGDLIMAIFGAPKSQPNDAEMSVRCAIEMVQRRQQLNETSRHKIKMGIGVARGQVVAGCMGSQDRLNYTVLGDRVNLASRLCSKAAASEIIVDEPTEKAVREFIQLAPVEPLALKGFSEKVPAFKILT